MSVCAPVRVSSYGVSMRFKQLTREDLTHALGRTHPLYWSDKLLHIKDLRVGPGLFGFGVRITGRYAAPWTMSPQQLDLLKQMDPLLRFKEQLEGLLVVTQRVDAPPSVTTLSR